MASVRLTPAELFALRILDTHAKMFPTNYVLLTRATRKVRDSLVTQGYAETAQVGNAIAYRITLAGRRAIGSR